jgi:hypothetical protein
LAAVVKLRHPETVFVLILPRNFCDISSIKASFRNLLGVLILATAAAVQAQFEYVTNADDTITITGYSPSGPDAVVIPSAINDLTVTAVGDGAFYDYGGLSSITIPSSVTTIGSNAFYNCTGLASVTMSDGLTNLAYGVFQGCSGLAEVTIPATVIGIGDYAFQACDGLTTVTIPSGVASIAGNAFTHCIHLTAIAVAAQNPYYTNAHGVLFDKNQSTLIECPGGIVGDYTIPSGVTTVGDYAFDWCIGLTNVTIPYGLTTIGGSAFQSCSALAGITIPLSVVSIGENAFFASGLTSVTIPSSVATIGADAFYGTPLVNIAIPGSVSNIEVGTFEYCTSLSSVTIFGGVTNIGEYAFAECGNLTQVYFTGNAPTADWSAFENMGYNSEFDYPYTYYVTTAYYLPGTTGWAEFSANADIPAVLWNPLTQASGASFGVRNNQFGFNITGTTNIPIVVEACTNLAQPVWAPLRSMTLTNGLVYFSEPVRTNNGGRFYRISAP